MDLEEYRKVYMNMEGVTNTPLNSIKRLIRLGGNIRDIPKALKADEKIRQEKKKNRKEIEQRMKKEGASPQDIKEALKNMPGYTKNTRSALARTERSAEAVARSVNELGQTSRSIVGTNRTNSYDGQDLEKGVSFMLTAKSMIAKGLHLPENMVKSAVNVGEFGKTAFEYAGESVKIHREKWEEWKKEREEEKDGQDR